MKRLLTLLILTAAACHGQANCFAHTATWGGGNAAAHTSPPINTTGATILVAAVSSATISILYMTDSVGNRDWETTANYNNGSQYSMILYKPNPITSTNYTFTIPQNSSGAIIQAPFLSVTLWACSGTSLDHPLAQQTGLQTSGSAATWQPGAVTPLEAGDLIFAAAEVNGNPAAATIDSGFSTPATFYVTAQAYGSAAAWLAAPNTSSVNPTWTTNSALTGWSGTIAVFRAATASPLTSTGLFVTTIVGNGQMDFTGDGGPALNAPSSYTGQIVKTSSGLLCFADVNNNKIRCFNPIGTPLTTYGVTIAPGNIDVIAGAATGTTVAFTDNVPPLSARFAHPVGLTIDSADCMYIGDQQNMAIRKMCPGGNVTTVAGRGSGGGNNNSCHTAGITDGYAGFAGDGGPATSALLNCPQGVAVDAAGNIIIPDGVNNRIRVVNTQATTQTLYGVSICAGCIQTIAGSASGACGTTTWIASPLQLYVDPSGNIISTAAGCNEIIKITPAGVISIIAGTGTQGYSGDGGLATAATLANPFGVGQDAAGNIYIADTWNNCIRMIDHTTGNISTVAGNTTLYPTGSPVYLHGGGFSGPNSWAKLAGFWYPIAIYADASTNRIYIGDLGTNRIRYLYTNPASITGARILSGARWSAGARVR